MRVLLVEDNADLAQSLAEYLEARGHVVDHAADGMAGLRVASTGLFDVVVLDLGLPKVDGIDVCRLLRAENQFVGPVLMLTARDTVDDKIRGFAAGADDYLVKPFSVRELEARLMALARRPKRTVEARVLRVSDLSLDLDSLLAHRGQRILILKPVGRRLLELLMRNSHRVMTRTELEFALWGDNPPTADSLRVHVHSLRKEVDGEGEPPLLHTVHGIGYRLAELP